MKEIGKSKFSSKKRFGIWRFSSLTCKWVNSNLYICKFIGHENSLSVGLLTTDKLTTASAHVPSRNRRRQNIHFHTNFQFISLVRGMWRSTFFFYLETIFRRSISLKQTNRTCWTIQTHSDELKWARHRTQFHELTPLSLVRLISEKFDVWPMHAHALDHYNAYKTENDILGPV